MTTQSNSEDTNAGSNQVATLNEAMQAISAALHGGMLHDQADEVWQLINNYTDKAMNLAREDERKLVQSAADHTAYEHFRDELQRLYHPQIQVVCKVDDIYYSRMIEDIGFAGDFIRVVISPSLEDGSNLPTGRFKPPQSTSEASSSSSPTGTKDKE